MRRSPWSLGSSPGASLNWTTLGQAQLHIGHRESHYTTSGGPTHSSLSPPLSGNFWRIGSLRCPIQNTPLHLVSELLVSLCRHAHALGCTDWSDQYKGWTPRGSKRDIRARTHQDEKGSYCRHPGARAKKREYPVLSIDTWAWSKRGESRQA